MGNKTAFTSLMTRSDCRGLRLRTLPKCVFVFMYSEFRIQIPEIDYYYGGMVGGSDRYENRPSHLKYTDITQ